MAIVLFDENMLEVELSTVRFIFFYHSWVQHLMFLDTKTCSVWTKFPFQVSSLRPFNKHKLRKKKLFGNFYAYDAIIGLNNELK